MIYLVVWLAAGLIVAGGWTLASRHIARQRQRDADEYGLLFGSDGRLRRQFMEHADHCRDYFG